MTWPLWSPNHLFEAASRFVMFPFLVGPASKGGPLTFSYNNRFNSPVWAAYLTDLGATSRSSIFFLGIKHRLSRSGPCHHPSKYAKKSCWKLRGTIHSHGIFNNAQPPPPGPAPTSGFNTSLTFGKHARLYGDRQTLHPGSGGRQSGGGKTTTRLAL